MALRLPALSRTTLPREGAQLVERLDVLANESDQGYVHADTSGGMAVLLVHRGKPFGAGTTEEGRFAPIPIPRFFQLAADAAALEWCKTDLPLFLCTAVLFRKAPAAQIPTALVDSARLLDSVRQMGKDAVLVVRRGEARSLVFCHGGEPAALYPADGQAFSEEGPVADRIVEYVYAGSETPDVTLDLYDEIRLPPAPEAGRTFADYATDAPEPAGGPERSLVVSLGERVVFRYPVYLEQFSVGRGGDNDLPLDNLSVSRTHARVRRQGQNLLFEDLGSENGLKVGDARVAHAELRPGDAIRVGKYTLTYRIFSPGEADLPAVVPDGASGPAAERTVAISSSSRLAELEHGGVRHKVGGWVYTVGTRADLCIRGWWIAPVHVRIQREPNGSYRLEHVRGLRAVRVNGEKVRRSPLSDGDEIAIGPTRMRFHLPAA